MQILPTAHPQLVAASKDLTEPAEKVRVGSSILRGYLDAPCADLGTALNRCSGSGRDTRSVWLFARASYRPVSTHFPRIP
jgi:hypothetical protein